MKEPTVEACKAIVEMLGHGSSKDGCAELWRKKSLQYHLSKAIGHLATHNKQIYDPRAYDGENHLKLAITRIAMILAMVE